MDRITPVLFKYYLTYENVKNEIIFAPKGWDNETIISYKRDLKYFGLIRNLSLPLKFFLDAKDILRAAFFKYGVEAGVRLEVEQRQNDWSYKNIFNSDLDFSTYNYDGESVSLELLESGIKRDVKVNENIKFEYKLTGDDVVDVIIPGVSFTDYAIFVPKSVDTSDLNQAKKFTIGLDQTKPFEATFLSGFNTIQRNIADTDGFDGDVFVRGNRPEGVLTRFVGNFKGYTFRQALSTRRFLYLQIRSTINNAVVRTLIISDADFGKNYFDVSFDFQYRISQNEGLYLVSRTDVNIAQQFLTVTEGEMRLSHASVSDPSTHKGLTAFSLYKRIINRISPAAQLNSNLLNTNYKNLIFTSGTSIRQLENPSIQISWNDFFETFKGLDDVAFGVENNIARLEKGAFFARFIQILDFGNVKECNITIAEELMFNSVKIGYNDGNTEDKDGREEYNSSQQWKLPFSNIDKEENLISPTRADQFGIEQIRIQFNIKAKENNDKSSDNENFMIDCNNINLDGKYTPILGSSYANVTGLSYPLTAYNLRLTPKKNLLRHEPYLRSILDKQDGRFIEFASAEKNAELSTTLNGLTIKENQSIAVSSLGGKYFVPYFATITTDFPKFALGIIDQNPFGFFKFNFNDEEYYGYIFELNIDLAANSEREIKLLLLDFPSALPPPVNPVPVVYGNDLLTLNFTKVCIPPAVGSIVPYLVPANTYTASTKGAANQLALNDANANGQNNADTLGTCTIPNNNFSLYYCFSAINTINGATMTNIITGFSVASGYARCLRALGSSTSNQVGVDPNVFLKVNIPAGAQNIEVGQIVNPNFYPENNLITPANSPEGQPTVIVQTDGKIIAQTASSFIGLNDVVIQLPYSFSPTATWITNNSFMCTDCEIVYDTQGNIISNSCGNVNV